jgi:hypothetical protein
MGWTELAAAAPGVVNFALVVRRSLWHHPFGLAMVALSFLLWSWWPMLRVAPARSEAAA